MRKPWKPSPHHRAEHTSFKSDTPWHGWGWLELAIACLLLLMLALA